MYPRVPRKTSVMPQEHSIARQPDLGQHAIQALPGAPHERSPGAVLLGARGPPTSCVIGAFGHIRRVRMEDDLRDYVEANGPRLSRILLFELASELQPTLEMERGP